MVVQIGFVFLNYCQGISVEDCEMLVRTLLLNCCLGIHGPAAIVFWVSECVIDIDR